MRIYFLFFWIYILSQIIAVETMEDGDHWFQVEVEKTINESRSKADFFYSVIKRLNWTSVTLFADFTTDSSTILMKLLTEDGLIQATQLSPPNRKHFRYFLKRDYFTRGQRLNVILCDVTCVQKIFELVSAEGSEEFLFSSKWLVMTNSSLPTPGKLWNFAYINQEENISRGFWTGLMTLEDKEFRPVQDINLCEHDDFTMKDYRERIFPNINRGFTGRTLRIGAAEWDLFLTKLPSGNGSFKYVGLGVDIIEELANNLNFSPQYIDLSHYVRVWETALDMILNKSLDTVAVPYMMSKERTGFLDFTYQVGINEIYGYFKYPSELDIRWRLLFDVLSAATVLLMVVLLFFTAIVLWICHNLQIPNSSVKKQIFKRLCEGLPPFAWFLYGHLLKQGQPIRLSKAMSTRFIVSAWCVFCLLLTVTFTAHLFATLGVRKRPALFRTFRDLTKQSDYKWGAFGGESAIIDYLQNTSDPVHKALYDGMKKFSETDPQVLSPQLSTHKRKLLNEKYVFLETRYTMQIFYSTNCDIVEIDDKIAAFPIAFPVQKNTVLAKLFSKWIVHYHENGMMDQWEAKWFSTRRCSVKQMGPTPLTLLHTQSVMLFIVSGITLSAMTLFFEILYHRRRTENLVQKYLGAKR